jgi:hypothetical protein
MPPNSKVRVSAEQLRKNSPVKTRQPPKAEKRELDRREWDFLTIPKSEIETCYICEFARELTRRSPRALNLYNKWRAGWKGKKRTPQFCEGREAYKEFRKIMTTCFSDFPFVNGGLVSRHLLASVGRKSAGTTGERREQRTSALLE